jgi:hypothetical protein
MAPPLFAAKAEAGSSTAITTHKTKRIVHLRFGFHANAQGHGSDAASGRDNSTTHYVFVFV